MEILKCNTSRNLTLTLTCCDLIQTCLQYWFLLLAVAVTGLCIKSKNLLTHLQTKFKSVSQTKTRIHISRGHTMSHHVIEQKKKKSKSTCTDVIWREIYSVLGDDVINGKLPWMGMTSLPVHTDFLHTNYFRRQTSVLSVFF
jgi:hypothetical protein